MSCVQQHRLERHFRHFLSLMFTKATWTVIPEMWYLSQPFMRPGLMTVTYSRGSQPGAIFAPLTPWEHLAVPRNLLMVTTRWISQTEARDAAKHPARPRRALGNRVIKGKASVTDSVFHPHQHPCQWWRLPLLWHRGSSGLEVAPSTNEIFLIYPSTPSHFTWLYVAMVTATTLKSTKLWKLLGEETSAVIVTWLLNYLRRKALTRRCCQIKRKTNSIYSLSEKKKHRDLAAVKDENCHFQLSFSPSHS